MFARRVPKHWVFKGINFVATGSSKNCYLYSLTHDLNADSMEKMDKNYATAVKIVQPELFLEALTESLHEEITDKLYLRHKLGQCVYIDRHQHYSNSVPPILIKPPCSSYQKEVRIVWEFLDGEIKPIIIESTKASSFCSIVSDEELQRSRTSMNPQNL